MGAKPPGSVVGLANSRIGSNEGGPIIGDVLETSTGRRYLILERHLVGRHRCRYVCVVMEPGDDYPPDAVRWNWAWSPRRRPRNPIG